MWILSAVSFFADVSGEMIYPLLPLFLVGVLGATTTHLGAIEGSAVLVVALLSAYSGLASDRSRRRVPWVRAGYALPVLGKATIALATVWPMVLAGRLLDRLGKGLRSSARDALIADAVHADQRGQAFGLHRAFDTAGAFVGVLLSASLLWILTSAAEDGTPAWVFRAIIGVGAVLGLASALLTLLVRESPGTGAADAPRAAGAATPLPRSYWTVLAALALFSLANSSDTFLLLRAHELGYAPWTVVLAYALYNLVYAACSYPAGLVSDRLGRWGLIGVGWAIYAGVYAGFALVTPERAWGVWPLMATYGVYMGLTDGVGKALIADHAPPDRRGAAMGLFYAVTGVTTLGASLLAGLVWEKAGPGAAFAIGAGIAALALVALACARGVVGSGGRAG